MSSLNWDTPILMSVSTNMTYFKSVKLPFKNILKVACTTGVQYCASTFKDEKRDLDHWRNGAQIIVIDFDEGLNEYTKSWLEQQLGFLVPTRSHLKEKRGKICERYRAILLAAQPMNVSAAEFVRIYQNLLKDNNLPADTSCTDVSRLYYGFGDPKFYKDIKVLKGKPLDWTKYNYKDTVEMLGLPSTKKVIDISEYETKIDLSNVPSMNHSKRYECPICALEGLDPHKHHLGFSPEKDLLTCFYDKEGHSPILRALYRKQILGLDPEIDEETQEIVTEEIPQPDGKIKKKRTVKPKMEECSACKGTGHILVIQPDGKIFETEETCPECQGLGKVPKKPKPKVKKPSLPDDLVPLKDRIPKGQYHFNERGVTTNFEEEYAKYVNEQVLAFDVETFYPKEVAVTEEQAKEMFKDKYISIPATYRRVVKNLKEKALDEIDNKVRLLIIGSVQHQTAFDLSICTPEQIQRLLNLVKSKLMVGHNLKFDLKSLASEYGIEIIPTRVFDTMLGSKMLWMMHNAYEPNENNTYGAVVQRWCGVNLPKDQGGSDWGQDNLTMEQLVYAVNDVRYLIPIYAKMIQEFYKEYKTNYVISSDINLDSVRSTLGDFIDIHPVMALEMRFVLTLVRMELKGIKVNESAIRDIIKTHLEEIKDAEEKLGFNPGSNPECLKFVKRIIGPQMESASKEALAEYYHIPQIEVLGRAKQAKSRAGLLVKMYEHKEDGRIHPQFTQILSTARLACIAEGSKISCINGLKNIEDVQVGDLVYCYDDNNNIQVRKVLNKYDNGWRECIQLCIGEKTLFCTPDHLIKTRIGWKPASKTENDLVYTYSDQKRLKKCETILPLGLMHVWDLEVEEFHNFIADEICVHNCKNPNMQQIPRTVKDYIYAAEPGTFVFSADYPTIELRLGAAYHQEPVMIEAFKHGEDLHYKMAHLMTGKPIPVTDEEKHDTTGKFINKEERTAAKNANFGYCYGAWWTSYQKVQLVKNHIKISDKDAKEAREAFMGLYKTLAQRIEQTKNRFKYGKPKKVQQKDSMGNVYIQEMPYTEEINTLFGRRIAVETANTALNYPVQGSGGDASKLAMCIFEDICKNENINAYLINMIHDDIVCQGSIEDKERAIKALATAMNASANLLMGHYFLTDVTDEVSIFAETPLEQVA